MMKGYKQANLSLLWYGFVKLSLSQNQCIVYSTLYFCSTFKLILCVRSYRISGKGRVCLYSMRSTNIQIYCQYIHQTHSGFMLILFHHQTSNYFCHALVHYYYYRDLAIKPLLLPLKNPEARSNRIICYRCFHKYASIGTFWSAKFRLKVNLICSYLQN